jgi:hypothetical protein
LWRFTVRQCGHDVPYVVSCGYSCEGLLSGSVDTMCLMSSTVDILVKVYCQAVWTRCALCSQLWIFLWRFTVRQCGHDVPYVNCGYCCEGLLSGSVDTMCLMSSTVDILVKVYCQAVWTQCALCRQLWIFFGRFPVSAVTKLTRPHLWSVSAGCTSLDHIQTAQWSLGSAQCALY